MPTWARCSRRNAVKALVLKTISDALLAQEGAGSLRHRDAIRLDDEHQVIDNFKTAEGEYDWTRQANERWFLRAAKPRGVPQFLAFVYSPPGRMIRNGLTFCEKTGYTGNLTTDFEAQYARYLADILHHFRQNPGDELKAYPALASQQADIPARSVVTLVAQFT